MSHRAHAYSQSAVCRHIRRRHLGARACSGKAPCSARALVELLLPSSNRPLTLPCSASAAQLCSQTLHAGTLAQGTKQGQGPAAERIPAAQGLWWRCCFTLAVLLELSCTDTSCKADTLTVAICRHTRRRHQAEARACSAKVPCSARAQAVGSHCHATAPASWTGGAAAALAACAVATLRTGACLCCVCCTAVHAD